MHKNHFKEEDTKVKEEDIKDYLKEQTNVVESERITTLFDIAGPKAKNYLQIHKIKNSICHSLRDPYLFYDLKYSEEFFNKFKDLIHRFLIYLLLESKPLFTVKKEFKNLEILLKEYAMERPLQYLKEYFCDDSFYNDENISLFDFDNTLQQDDNNYENTLQQNDNNFEQNNSLQNDTLQNESLKNNFLQHDTLQNNTKTTTIFNILTEMNRDEETDETYTETDSENENETDSEIEEETDSEEEIDTDTELLELEEEEEEEENFRKKKKTVNYVPPFISNYFLNITKKYFPKSKFRKTLYNEIKFKSFEGTYLNIKNRLIFNKRFFYKFIKKYFNINFDIFKNKNITNIVKKYLTEIICSSFCTIGECVAIEILLRIVTFNFKYFIEIKNNIFSLKYLNIYCFSLLFINDFTTIIQKNNDLLTFTNNNNNTTLQNNLQNTTTTTIASDFDDFMTLFSFPTIFGSDKLAIDIHSIILRFIQDFKELLKLRLICKYWNNLIVNDNDIWKYHCYYTLISDSLFNLCDTKSLPFIEEFEERFKTINYFTFYFTKIKPFLNFKKNNTTKEEEIEEERQINNDFSSYNERYKEFITDETVTKKIEEINKPPIKEQDIFGTFIYINQRQQENKLTVTKGSTKFVCNVEDEWNSKHQVFEPDLPPGFTMKEDEMFIGQLNCKELSRFFCASYLPKTGMIYIFKNIKNYKNRIEYINYEFNYDKFNAIEICVNYKNYTEHDRNVILRVCKTVDNFIYLIQTVRGEKIGIRKEDLIKRKFKKSFSVSGLKQRMLDIVSALNRKNENGGCTKEQVFEILERRSYGRSVLEENLKELLKKGVIFWEQDKYFANIEGLLLL